MSFVSKLLLFIAGVLVALNIAAFSLVFFPEAGVGELPRTRTIEHHHYYYFYLPAKDIPKGGDNGNPGNPPQGPGGLSGPG